MSLPKPYAFLAKDFLLEIGCAELPAKGLLALARQLSERLSCEIKNACLDFSETACFASPRRLAVLIKDVSAAQPERIIEKRGPVLTSPEAAVKGFAQSCGVSAKDLIQKGNYYYYQFQQMGENVQDLLPGLVKQTLSKLSGLKTMRWGSHCAVFVRPVYWVVMLYGETVLKTNLLTVTSAGETRGHCFHSPGKIKLLNASDYEERLLEEGFVYACFERRKKIIRGQISNIAHSKNVRVMIDEDILTEVTGLVEWPTALLCEFSQDFLSLPKEALISSMQHHQKCFPVCDSGENLLPFFIVISNIESSAPEVVIAGNERVMKARLSDAAFFFEQDKKILLDNRLKSLEKVIFHEKLGSMADKTAHIITAAEKLAEKIHADKLKVRRAAALCKADLMTQMVNEFPELQGIMGGYYANAQGEAKEIEQALREHCLPRFAGDKLPQSAIGCVIALADRLDTLNRLFNAGEMPLSEKDPFGLRRAAMGIIRIIIEKDLKNITLSDFCETSLLKKFMLDRLPAYYADNPSLAAVLPAALEVQKDNLADLHQRMLALQKFLAMPEAAALCEANKRVKNILTKNNLNHHVEKSLNNLNLNINPNLFESQAEKDLYQAVISFSADTQILGNEKNHPNYSRRLEKLAEFKDVIDKFFKDVRVESGNEKVKNNRLGLLALLYQCFLNIADISMLQFKDVKSSKPSKLF